MLFDLRNLMGALETFPPVFVVGRLPKSWGMEIAPCSPHGEPLEAPFIKQILAFGKSFPTACSVGKANRHKG
ncbi:hypothetical protein A6B38_05905 [Bartonella bacilliformis]|uniref:Uncharacterized protein n=1 Tax=Bartonella bacilliformis INS TaxID=1206782 RepID=A0ABP2SP38_BARBA|nr:hypothetical protein AL467_01200 [Bartonella bacilliformis]EKS45864.1 hypothetical protein BbINS_01086 [Bartonella bacilliformis INS]KZN21333.1 hypothetical protein A6B38_05905 [Bartonella bacilliformis]